MKTDAAPKADLSRLKQMFEQWRDGTETARRESEIDIDYYDTDQWTEEERRILRRRKQPIVTFNHVKRAINGTLGVVERGKSEPRAYPRTPKDEGSADVATDVLRYIADQNRFDYLKSSQSGVFKDMLVAGTGATIVEVDADSQVVLRQIRWEEFVHDPRSRRNDFKDAKYLGIAKWMYADDVAGIYPDAKTDLEATVNDSSLSPVDQLLQDRPNTLVWVDRRGRRVMVVELYYREGSVWRRAVYHAGGVLEEGDSPYLNAKGQPDCPIEAVSAYVKKDNSRYGAVRDMRGPQDEVNQRRSKLLHISNSRQLQETQIGAAAAIDPDQARAEAARPDGIIPMGMAIAGTGDMAAGQRELLAEAKAEIALQAPNEAILGREGADSSGRALLARQQSGLVELAVLFGGLEDWELRVYRQAWARVRQFWAAPMFIRVTDDEGDPRFVGLNQPRGNPIVDPNTGQPAVDPKTGEPMETEPPIDPNTGGAILGYKNRLAEMDVDIIIDATPESANIQQEMFTELAKLIGANPVYAQQVPFDVLIELAPIPRKKDIRDKIKQAREEAQQQQAQQAQAAQQLAAQEEARKNLKAQTDADESASKSELNRANAQSKSVETQLSVLGAVGPMLPAAGVTGAPLPPAQPEPAPMPYPG